MAIKLMKSVLSDGSKREKVDTLAAGANVFNI
jgi:hypothetical protein